MNISNFDISVIYTRPDGSYVIDNGMYHVPNEGEYTDLWAQVHAYAQEHPEVVTSELSEPELTPEEQEVALQRYYTDLIQKILDAEAKKLGYDSCLSVCSYINTGVQKFDDEGVAFRTWRSAVWAKSYEILDNVQSGKIEIPSEEELIKMLPKLKIVYN